MSDETAAQAPDVLPPLYARWMAALLGGPPPLERKATCSDCAMCAKDDRPAAPDQTFFAPTVKCCTFLPELPNYLVGGALLDEALESPAGRRTIEARIDAKVEVSPMGLGRSRLYLLKYERGAAGFGKAQSMRCPHHLADGRCGVWPHRDSTCATWFCKHERGKTGSLFWQRAHDLLERVEGCLSRHCVCELAGGASALEALFPPRGERGHGSLTPAELDGQVEEERYAAIWGEWLHRERDFYAKCAELVRGLAWADVLRLGGAELHLVSKLARSAYARATTDEVPARVQHRQIQVRLASAERTRVVTYSGFDPIELPARLLHVLHEFDGRPTEQALSAIEAAHGLRIRPALVRKLVDFALLDEV